MSADRDDAVDSEYHWSIADESKPRGLGDRQARHRNDRDVRTADLLTERIGRHEENSWMLRSILA